MRTRLIAVSVVVLAALGTVAALTTVGSEAAGTTRTVRVLDYDFSPSVLTVARGTTVRWVWAGRAVHDVDVLRGPQQFHSELMRTGSYRRRFTRSGTYRIECSVHGAIMRMTVRVR